VKEINNSRATAFATSLKSPTQLANAARSGDHRSCRRVVRLVLDEFRSLSIIQQLSRRVQEFWRFDDRDGISLLQIEW